MQRRTFLKAVAAAGLGAVAVGSLAGCAPGEEPAPVDPTDTAGPINADIAFAMYPGYLALMTQYVFDPYTAENSGVTVEGIEGPASQTYAQILASTEGNRPFHGGMMNDALSWSGVKDGLWQTLGETEIPNLAKVPAGLRNDAGIPWAFNGFGISYNPEKIPGGIQSWTDLYDPALKGRVAMWPAYFDAYLMAAVAAGANETEVEKGIEAWKAAKDNIGMWITSVADLHQAMDRGEIWAAPDYLGTTVRDAKAGMKLAFSIPAEGAVLNTYQLDVVNGISDDETRAMAGLFDRILDESTQSATYDTVYLIPANGEVKVDASKAQIAGIEDFDFTATSAQERFYKADYKWVGENTAKIKALIEDNLL